MDEVEKDRIAAEELLRKIPDRKARRAARQRERYATDPEFKARHLGVCLQYRERLIAGCKRATEVVLGQGASIKA
jgi:hypothetical protein